MSTVVLIADSDPRKQVFGGIGVYTKYYLEYLIRNDRRVIFIGKATKGPILRHYENLEFIEAPAMPKPLNSLFFLALVYLNRILALPDDAVIHAHRPDWIVPFIKRKNKKAITLHGSHARNVYLKKGFLSGKLYSFFEWLGFRAADRIISVSEDTIAYYQKLYKNDITSKMTYIPPGIDLKAFEKLDRKEARKKYGVNEDQIIVLFLGRFEKEKNPGMLLRAIKEADVTGFFVGTGALENYLKDLAGEINADVKFQGPVDHERVPEILACADVLGLTSLYEGFPLVLIEAMAAGVPCISTDVGDVRKIIEDGVTGYIVDDLTIADKLRRLSKISAEMRCNCIARAREFTWDNNRQKDSLAETG